MRPRALSGLLLISHTLLLTSSVCVSQTITTKPTSATLASGEHNERPVLQYLGADTRIGKQGESDLLRSSLPIGDAKFGCVSTSRCASPVGKRDRFNSDT